MLQVLSRCRDALASNSTNENLENDLSALIDTYGTGFSAVYFNDQEYINYSRIVGQVLQPKLDLIAEVENSEDEYYPGTKWIE